MRFRATSVALLAAFLFIPGCSAVDGPTLDDLSDATGCTFVRPAAVFEQDVRVLRVTVRDCDQPVSGPDDAERVAVAAWQYLGHPVDRVDVTSFPAAMRSTTVSFPGNDLAGQHTVNSLPRSPGNSGTGSNSPLWLLLPLAYVAVAAAMLTAVRRLRRAGVFFVIVRR